MAVEGPSVGVLLVIPVLSDVVLTADSVGIALAGLLTIVVFSYLAGDNPLYRVAQHLLVGTAIGYALVVVGHQVIFRRLVPALSNPLSDGWVLLIPTALGMLLLARLGRRAGWIANWGLTPIIGVGAALALTGALIGSLLPQIDAAAVPLQGSTPGSGGLLDVVGRLVLLVGAVCTLIYFYLQVRPDGKVGLAINWAGVAGKWVMMVAFGALFASIAIGRVSLLVGRVHFLLHDWLGLISR